MVRVSDTSMQHPGNRGRRKFVKVTAASLNCAFWMWIGRDPGMKSGCCHSQSTYKIQLKMASWVISVSSAI